MTTLTTAAGRLQRITDLIADEELPDAQITVGSDTVLVGVSDGLVENTVRRWAAALDLLVSDAPCDMPDGTAGTEWAASGFDGHGVWWFIHGRACIPAAA